MRTVLSWVLLVFSFQAAGISDSVLSSSLCATSASLRLGGSIGRRADKPPRRRGAEVAQSDLTIGRRLPLDFSPTPFQQTTIQTLYDKQKNVTTVLLPTTRISGEKDRYHSLDFSISYNYVGETKHLPDRVKVELISVVKARRLNTDLNVVFVLDGEEKHFGSSRSAILKPVPGRLWIGEQMIFSIPFSDFEKFASAERIGVKLGSVAFEFDNEARDLVREFSRAMKE